MTPAVSRPPLTAAARVCSFASACEIFVRQSGTVTGFSRNTSVFPVTVIPSILHIRLHLLVAVRRKTNGRSLGTFQKEQCSFLNRGALDSKVLLLFFL